LRNGQHIVLLRNLTGDLFHSGNIHRQLRKVGNLQVQAAAQCFQHLPFVDKAQLLQGLAQTQIAVLFLVGKRGVDLLGVDVAKLLQDIT